MEKNIDIFPRSISQSRIQLVSRANTISLKKISKYNINTEYQILSQCSHPNIIKVYELFDNFSYSMEYCEQGDLNTGLPYPNFDSHISDFSQICNSVQYLHNKNICHLDIKLQNFVRNNDGVIKLIDFGHAASSQQLSTKPLGTTEYNSHERYESAYDGKKADIFSLGICLTGLMVGYIPCVRNWTAFPNSPVFKVSPDRFWDNLESFVRKNHPDFIGLDELAVDLVNQMVRADPVSRPDINEVLSHEFFS